MIYMKKFNENVNKSHLEIQNSGSRAHLSYYFKIEWKANVHMWLVNVWL